MTRICDVVRPPGTVPGHNTFLKYIPQRPLPVTVLDEFMTVSPRAISITADTLSLTSAPQISDFFLERKLFTYFSASI